MSLPAPADVAWLLIMLLLQLSRYEPKPQNHSMSDHSIVYNRNNDATLSCAVHAVVHCWRRSAAIRAGCLRLLLLCIAEHEVLQFELVDCAAAEQQHTGQNLLQQLTGNSSWKYTCTAVSRAPVNCW